MRTDTKCFTKSKMERLLLGFGEGAALVVFCITTAATDGLCAGLFRRNRRHRLRGNLRCCHPCQLSWRSCPLSPC